MKKEGNKFRGQRIKTRQNAGLKDKKCRRIPLGPYHLERNKIRFPPKLKKFRTYQE